jgi:hypothetical protein
MASDMPAMRASELLVAAGIPKNGAQTKPRPPNSRSVANQVTSPSFSPRAMVRMSFAATTRSVKAVRAHCRTASAAAWLGARYSPVKRRLPRGS